MILENDVLILVLIISYLLSFIKAIKVKYILWALGVNFLLLIPIFLGYEYRYFIIKDVLYLFLIFFISGLLYKAVNTSKSKYLIYIFLLCMILLGVNSFKDGFAYQYRVDVDPVYIENKYLVTQRGIQTSLDDSVRYNLSPIIYKFHCKGIFRKYSDRDVIKTDKHTFEHRLEDGNIILYNNGVYSLLHHEDNK